MSALQSHGPRRPGLLDSARRMAPLAWPVFIGQVAVLAFSTVDTLLVARYAAVDLAALAVGAAVYITVFIGLMGVVLAIVRISANVTGDFGNVTDFDRVLGCAGKIVGMARI